MAKQAILDRTRPFGDVYGDDNGVRYEQDHKQFDAQGKEIMPPAPPKPDKPAAKPRKTAAKKKSTVTDELPAGVNPEDMPLKQVTMAQLRARYTEVTNGKKAKVGLSKATLVEMINDESTDSGGGEDELEI